MKGRYFSYLNTAAVLISQYGGEEPFHLYLKNYFRQHAKHGSRDRKTISKLCYACLRMGRALADNSPEDQLLASLYLCSEDPDEILNALRPLWTAEPLSDKLVLLKNVNIKVDPERWFPLADQLSAELRSVRSSFISSHLVQPRLFLRIRPGYEAAVVQKLHRAGVSHNVAGATIELANSIDLETVLRIDQEVVVQDMSSQHTGRQIAAALDELGPGAHVWDCCAGSGGKSLMAYDQDPGIRLSVSDVRASILHNLKQRFNVAGIRDYKAFEMDLNRDRNRETFDLVLADVPCSGSGTWGRTPEMLAHFSSDMLDRYVQMQRSIVQNASFSVRQGGQLVYITCSAYHQENEGMVEYMSGQPGWELVAAELMQGWMHGADTMFAARFRRL